MQKGGSTPRLGIGQQPDEPDAVDAGDVVEGVVGVRRVRRVERIDLVCELSIRLGQDDSLH